MLETWDWYIDRFVDAPVADIVRRRVFITPIAYSAWEQPTEYEASYTLKDLSRWLHKDEKRIRNSLLRLERRGKVEVYRGGWRWKG